MAVIQHLLRRWGFVKLGSFGLVLTPEGRILAMRPAVLDDGAGGRIVGWQDGDLAMAELRPWEPAKPAKPAAPRSVARRAAVAQPPAPLTFPPPAYQAVISEASVMAQRPVAMPETPAVAAGVAVPVAPEPMVEEDDWEWTIALARARAAEQAGAPRSPSSLEPARPEPARPERAATAAAATRTRPMAVVAARDPATSGEWPRTETAGAIDYEDYCVISTRPAMAIPSVVAAMPRPAAPTTMPHSAAPTTVIPVPVLPTMQSTAQASRLTPVVRSQVPAASPRRFPKGTGPVSPRTTSRMAAMSEVTELDVRVGDQTTPGIALPRAARAVQLPSIKRGTVTR